MGRVEGGIKASLTYTKAQAAEWGRAGGLKNKGRKKSLQTRQRIRESILRRYAS